MRIISLLFLKDKRVVIYYLLSSRSAAFVERHKVFFSLRGVTVQKMPFDILGMVFSSGRSVLDSAYADDVNQVMEWMDKELFDAGRSLLAHLPRKLHCVKDDLKLWLKQGFGQPLYDVMLVIETASWLKTELSSPLYGNDVRVILEKTSAFDFVKRILSLKEIDCFDVQSQVGVAENPLFSWIYNLLNLCRSFFSGSPRPQKGRHQKPKVGVLHYGFGGNHLTDPYKKNYSLFWFGDSGLPAENVLIFSRRSTGITADEIVTARSRGFGMTACDGLLKKSNPLIGRHAVSGASFSLFFKYLFISAGLSWKAKGAINRSECRILSVLFSRLAYWEDFFRSNNIVILFKPGTPFADMDIAAKLKGSFVVSFQYSDMLLTDMFHYDNCDAFFVWSRRYVKVYNNIHSQAAFFVESGYCFDYIFKILKDRTARYRAALLGRKFSFVISVFDETLIVLDDAYAFSKRVTENMLLAYKNLFEYVLKDPEGMIIIKPKKAHNIKCLKESTYTRESLSELQRQKRVEFFEPDRFPVEAGMVSDVTVGLISNSAAVLECQLAGIPGIFYDSCGSRELNPDYKTGKGKLIFDDPESMIRAIDGIRNREHDQSFFTDHFGSLEVKDAYRDGRASVRIGYYIKTLFDNAAAGRDRNEALSRTNQAYAAEHGLEVICSLS
ncbi:MAG TPA: hypothetical protein DD723_10505 [Candidatus Omnitrophica bacterium]|nr:MAG: hypothetical protein A2Z81_09845 [Omnitrophica WOR_2 bacterium GWA2_45_18]OGX19881.1 MAG: hypothetical protein A2Y04_02460 [Omnitrophica WOR_2 bacterium GWC2_45_7]HBR15947.1 hypothetical protein [Candidatus Omnitrophota bacterium]